MDIRVKFMFAVQTEGLNKDGTKDILSKYGTVEDIRDIPDDKLPMTLYLVDAKYRDFLRCKRDLNCVTADNNEYILVPMESPEAAKKVNDSRKGVI